MPTPRTILLTGAAGGLGTLMRGLLPSYGYRLRLLDLLPIDGEPDAITADLADRDALRAAVRGVDAVVHLAGISLESTFEKILRANIEGTYNLYEAAREEGVRRIVSASSNHAVGFTRARGATTRSSRSAPRAAPTPTTACPSASARIWRSCTPTCTGSTRCRSGSGRASPSRRRSGCCRSG